MALCSGVSPKGLGMKSPVRTTGICNAKCALMGTIQCLDGCASSDHKPSVSQMLLWLLLLSLSLPLLLWFAHVITRDGRSPVLQSSGLRGYVRISPGRMEQVRSSDPGSRGVAPPPEVWVQSHDSGVDPETDLDLHILKAMLLEYHIFEEYIAQDNSCKLLFLQELHMCNGKVAACIQSNQPLKSLYTPSRIHPYAHIHIGPLYGAPFPSHTIHTLSARPSGAIWGLCLAQGHFGM